jgi:hypothetical protein
MDSSDHTMFKFETTINGQTFDYFKGLGHVKIKGIEKTTDHVMVQLSDQQLRQVSRELYNKKAESCFRTLIVALPKLDEVLHCLFLDSQAHDESFCNWCANFGYDTDSISARDTYDKCTESYFKLRHALGNSFNDERERIEKLEL